MRTPLKSAALVLAALALAGCNGDSTTAPVVDITQVNFASSLGVRQVIAGWDEGIAGMKVGGTTKLVIPPSLAYGAAGRSGIPGNSILVFTVTLISIP